MKTHLTILGMGALLLVGASADSGPSVIGRYQIVSSVLTANAWRVDTVTGQVEYCIAITEVHQLPDCYPARMQSKSPYSP